MYLSNTSNKVKDLFERLEEFKNTTKFEVCIYLFEEWNNGLINEKNETNPSATDEDFEIFKPTNVGLSEHFAHSIGTLLLGIMNNFTEANQQLTDDLLTINLDDDAKQWVSTYEKLDFSEKIDVIGELLIRYDNEELFEGLYHFPVLSEDDGFNVALNIKDYKSRIFGGNEETDFPYEIVD